MKIPHLTPDDPRLTAYALGELNGDERAAVEAAVRKDPALRAVVAEIRAVAGEMESSLAAEAAAQPLELEPVRPARRPLFFGRAWPKALPPRKRRRRVPVEDKTDPAETPAPADAPPSVAVFPHAYSLIGVAAAACFALLVVWRAPAPREAREVAAETDFRRVSDVALVAPPGAPPVVEAAPPGPTEPGPVAPVWVQRDLSLLAQAQRGEVWVAPRVESGAAPDRVPDSEEPASPAAHVAAAPVDPAPAAVAAQAEPRTVEPIAFAVAPPPSGDVLAQNIPLGALVTDSPVVAIATPAHSSLFGEAVVLSAMRVTASRAVGFALPAESAASRGYSGIYDRDLLPRPPPGARFTRGREVYAFARDNDFVPVGLNALSTFSIDVDTASYASVRRLLASGTPPPRDAVRIEELLNYFPYRYEAPRDGAPVAATLEVAAAPWNPAHRLVRIGLKAHEVRAAERPAASLVFLLDVSSSMHQPHKLPLVRQSLRLLIGRLRPDDRVAIVTYAGKAGLVLPSTPVSETRQILNALDALSPEGDSNGSAGIQLAYEVAQASFRPDGTNRIILCTDGDFDLGVTSEGDLVRLVEQQAKTGVFLTVLGFGMGNYKDAQLEKLSLHGNGTYGYIDTHREAEKLLVEQVSSTLVTVARDVKLQVEFNPARVASYRLIGYENRLLRREDFNLESRDAGEIGAGHTVTALYEVVPLEADPAAAALQAGKLRYSRVSAPPPDKSLEKELLTVKVRYKKPQSFLGWPRTLEFSLADSHRAFGEASADFRFAAAVAQFGMILRHSPHRGDATLDDVAAWAAAAAGPGDDPGGYRHEFIELVRKALTLPD